MRRGVLATAAPAIFCAVAVGREDVKDDALQGVWVPEKAEYAGKMFPEEARKSIRLEVKDDEYVVTAGNQTDKGKCKVDASADPKTLDITGSEGPNKGKTMLCIYERKGDMLRVCYDLSGKERPKEFKTTEGSKLFLVEYKLQKP